MAGCLGTFIIASFCGTYITDKFTVNAYYIQPTQEEIDKLAYTPLHYLAMGLNENLERKTYGAFNAEDDKNTSITPGKENKNRQSLELIKKRINDFGVAGLLRHFLNKFIWVTTDGSFAYRAEGRKTVEQFDILQQMGNSWIDYKSNFHQIFLANLQQGCWLSLWLFALAGNMIRKRNTISFSRKIICFILELSMIGIILFLVLFEASPRYMFLYTPVLTGLAAINSASLFCKNKPIRSNQA